MNPITLPQNWLDGIRRYVPAHMMDGLVRYIEHGIQPGSFLRAVLVNDLKEACAMADEENKYRLYDFVYALYNYAPSTCWGSEERVQRWIDERTKGGTSEATKEKGTEALLEGVRDPQCEDEAPILPNSEG